MELFSSKGCFSAEIKIQNLIRRTLHQILTKGVMLMHTQDIASKSRALKCNFFTPLVLYSAMECCWYYSTEKLLGSMPGLTKLRVRQRNKDCIVCSHSYIQSILVYLSDTDHAHDTRTCLDSLRPAPAKMQRQSPPVSAIHRSTKPRSLPSRFYDDHHGAMWLFYGRSSYRYHLVTNYGWRRW